MIKVVQSQRLFRDTQPKEDPMDVIDINDFTQRKKFKHVAQVNISKSSSKSHDVLASLVSVRTESANHD